MNTTAVILTSVVVAVLVSSIVSSIFSLVGQSFERSARHKELIFMKALELATAKIDLLTKYAKETGRGVRIQDAAVYAERHYSLLDGLHRNGLLPENWRDDDKQIPVP